MKTFSLVATPKTSTGKKASKAIRQEDNIPCVIYGNGENIHATVSKKDVKGMIFTPNTYLIEIDINGKKEKTIIKDMQFHPVSDEVLHIDFYRVDENKPVQVLLPVNIFGNSEGVKLGGKLMIVSRKLKVKGLIKDLPEQLDVDITKLGMGKSTFVSEISYPNLEILSAKTNVICAVKMTRAARGAAAKAAETKAKK